jgi:thiamine pyridinylase
MLNGFFVASCCTVSPRKAPAEEFQKKSSLKVALFPWIPDAANDDFESIRKRLEERFEQQNPTIDLTLRLEEYDDSYYEPAKLAGWLASKQYDLVEIDTVILGDLVAAEVVEPWSSQNASDFFPAAVQASVVRDEDGKEEWWGVPHLLCGYFLVSKSSEVDGATTLAELTSAIGKLGKPVLGNFDSSWDLPSLYLDSRVDNGLDPAEVAKAIKPPLHEGSAESLRSFASLCEAEGSNHCTDGTYSDNWDDPVKKFVSGEASAFWGYSERLHLTVQELRKARLSEDDLHVNTVPLGGKATPLLFTDAFVRRAGCAQDAACDQAVEAFIRYINSEEAVAEVLLSRDAEAMGLVPVPRYLLPAKRSAFEIDGIKEDRLYGELKPFAEGGFALPNAANMYERRRVLAWLLEQRIKE